MLAINCLPGFGVFPTMHNCDDNNSQQNKRAYATANGNDKDTAATLDASFSVLDRAARASSCRGCREIGGLKRRFAARFPCG